MLTRLLDWAVKQTPEGEVRVSLVADQKGMLLGLTPAGSSTLRQLADWVDSDPPEIKLEGDKQVLAAGNAMVAGKWNRRREGNIRITPSARRPSRLANSLPI